MVPGSSGRISTMLSTFMGIFLGIAAGLLMLAWIFQEKLLFFPPPRAAWPGARSGAEAVSVLSADGKRLRGWFVRSGMGTAPAPLVIYFGGNAEEVSWLVSAAERFAGWSLLLVNYRGYGDSEGRPGEKALFEDALRVYDYANRRADVIPGRIVAMGRSLGSGVAVYLAANRPLRGVILVSPYDSMVEVAKHHYPFLPISLLLRHRFDSLSRAPLIDAPLLCLIASEDRIVPPERSRILFDAWRGRKTLHQIARADHDRISDDAEYWRSIARFLQSAR